MTGLPWRRSWLVAAIGAVVLASPAAAQQRPLVTEDPEPIGSGRLLIESGVDNLRDAEYPVSGLEGNLWRVPTFGLSFGLSAIAELQIDGGFYDRLAVKTFASAPLSNAVTFTGTTTHDWEDTIVATKVRIFPEGASHPSFGVRFATKLPNAENETGLGLDTTDFYATILAAKTMQSVRLVGNLGIGILGDPTDGQRQNDVVTYGVSFARALTDETEVVGEFTGRVSTRKKPPFPGTETRGLLKLGGRFTHGSLRLDGAVFVGTTSVDPTVGFTGGFTYIFNAFNIP